MDNKTKELVVKSIIKDFDDGQNIFLDWNKLSEKEINEIELAYFDVINIPYDYYMDSISKYYCTFFKSEKSSTGYIGMFVNKNKEIFKTKQYSRSYFI